MAVESVPKAFIHTPTRPSQSEDEIKGNWCDFAVTRFDEKLDGEVVRIRKDVNKS